MKNTLLCKLFLFSAAAVSFFACDSGDKSSKDDDSGSGNIGAHAALPSNQNAGKVHEMYNGWISAYYITYEEEASKPGFNEGTAKPEAKGTARIRSAYNQCSDGSCTVSEAIGYGMILTSLMEDWEKFDKLFAYSKAFRISGSGLMRWQVVGFTSAQGGSATDADIDIAAALFIAYNKTGKQEYLNDAIEIGASIYEFEVDESTKLILPAANYDAKLGKGNIFNISYMSLPAIKMFAKHDNSRDWNAVLEACIAYMQKVQNAGDGLWPDWSDASGAAADPDNNSNTRLNMNDGSTANSWESYYKETPRIPWRIAWHYHWFGDSRAKEMLDKGMSFLRSTGVEDYRQLKECYSYTGSKECVDNATAARYSSLCALGMGNSANQEWLNSCNEKLTSNISSSIPQYYGSSLQLIYSMLFNGKF